MPLHLSAHLGWMFESLMEFCYPGSCAICHEPAPSRDVVCPRCDGFLRLLEEEAACRGCGMPLPAWDGPCPYCMGKGRGRIRRILRLGRFIEPLRGMIHTMKYHGRWTVGEYLAERLLEDVAVQTLLHECDVLAPVPLHWRRQIHRGYNQAAVIAECLGRQTHRPVVWPIRRLRDTPTQTGMRSPAARQANLRGAFGLVRPKSIFRRHVVLVDDVMTSGATLLAMSRAMRAARPSRISAIVVAVADPHGRGFEVI